MASYNSNKYFRVLLLALLLPLISGDCIDLDLGMENGQIQDNKITASSETAQAKNGRLNKIGSWCAATSDSNPYLQIDLQTLHIICAVSTQGNPHGDQWVETYTLQISTDGTTWTNFREFGQVKTFTGNSDMNAEKKNILYEGVLTRWLRFVGKTSNGRFCMRTEVFGVNLKPENLAAGKTTGQSSTYSTGDSVKAVDGNADTDYDNGHCSQTNENNSSWWRVDLGSNDVPVSEVRIVNRFSQYNDIRQRNQDYKITLGTDQDVTNNPECVGRYTFIQFIASAVCYRNPLKTGRYLGIMTTQKQILQLCEVEVYSRDNLAYNKSTAQISTYQQFNSGLAVDGNSNTGLFSGGRSCTHTLDETNPWWRVDLGQVEPVTEVYIVTRGDCCWERLNPFEIRVGTNSSNGGITNSKCGDGGYSIPEGKGASFFCRPSLYGRYVTIRVTKSILTAFTVCEVEVYSARRACPIQPLGLANSYIFPDSRFSALTSRSGNEASKGRLNGNSVWSPSRNDNDNDYLQINLQYEFFICAVATQGSPSADRWTTKYKLRLSLNNTDWVTYQENGAVKIFNANDGRHDIVKHSLVGINRAKHIRFQPTEFSSRKALRVEVYGVLTPTAPSHAPTSFIVTPLSSTSVHASWQLPTADSIHGAITGFKLLYRNISSAADSLTIIIIGSNSTFAKNVTGLGKFTEYEFQVLAFSSSGNGPQSPAKVVRTHEDVPSQYPSSFTLTANTSTSITADWQLPLKYSRNGIIVGFKLFYKKKGSSEQERALTISNGTILTIDVAGLDKFTEYEFQVLALTSVGDGPRSPVLVNRTKEDAPGVDVQCNSDNMTITIPKSLLRGMDREHLRLLDTTCKATETSAFFSLTTPLSECNTTIRHTPTAIVYSNTVLEIPVTAEDVVTRVREIEIQFSCFYSKYGVVSSVGWKPSNRKLVFSDEGQGNFTLSLNMFPDKRFVSAYTRRDFPVAVVLRKLLFFEVSVTSDDKQLSIRADRCYATPTQDRMNPVKYEFIKKGCPNDSTMKYRSAPSVSVQRFSLEAFKFIADHPFVFVHCHVVVCNATDPGSKCAKSCSSGGRGRREVSAHVIDAYPLSQGPIHLTRKKREEKHASGLDKIGSSPTTMMTLFLMCVACLAGTALIALKKSRDKPDGYTVLATDEQK